MDDASTPHSVAFLAWSSVSGRPNDIARVLNGDARCYYPLRIRRRSLLPVRYALSAAQMIGYLARHRPRAVIVTNPPIFAPLLAYGYARLTDARLLLDSHPDAFREGRSTIRVSSDSMPGSCAAHTRRWSRRTSSGATCKAGAAHRSWCTSHHPTGRWAGGELAHPTDRARPRHPRDGTSPSRRLWPQHAISRRSTSLSPAISGAVRRAFSDLRRAMSGFWGFSAPRSTATHSNRRR